MSTCVVLNPASRQGDRESEVRQQLAGLPDVVLWKTEGEGHGRQLAERAVEEGFGTVVAAGGDGTVNEVLAGIGDHLGRVRLALLPLGTGNDLARSLGVPDDLDGAVEVLRKAATARCDVVRVRQGETKRRCLNVATFGLTGRVSERVTPELKQSWGPLSYARAAAECVSELEHFAVELALDDEPTQQLELVNLIVANGRYAAAGIPVAPQAELDDGLLDVLVVTCGGTPELLTLAARVVTGNHLDAADPRISFRRARRVRLRPAEPVLPLYLDGEPGPEGQVELEVEAGALEVVVGPGAAVGAEEPP